MSLRALSLGGTVQQPILGHLLRQPTKSQASAKAWYIYNKADTSTRTGNVTWWGHHFHYMYNLMVPINIINDNNNNGVELDIFDKEYNHSYDKKKLGNVMKETALFIQNKRKWNENHINDIVDCLQFTSVDEQDALKHRLLKIVSKIDLNFRLNEAVEDYEDKIEYADSKEFWGKAQQLYCGKILSDALDTHAILESIMHPCGGIVGPGDNELNPAIKFGALLFIPSKVLFRHAVAHDAYGHLYTKYNIGPGYTYVDWQSSIGQFPLIAGNPLSDQLDGVCWWLKRHYNPPDDRFIQGSIEMDHYTPAKF